MLRSGALFRSFLASFLIGVSVVSCVDHKIVYKEKTLFQQPQPAALNFLGYSDTTAKLTVCGNCHVGFQASWIKTKHASAWADLEASGHATDACRECHSVDQLGNPVTGAAGWTATQETRYHDVQCESCHGPGLNHVENPDATQPLASIAIDTDSTTRTNGCAECHNGSHHPFVEQWALAGHSTVNSHAASNAACVSCHTAQGALAAWGVTGNYVEKDSAAQPIVCAVCHDPHGSPYAHQLRFPINTTSIQEHLCARCHDRSSNPTPADAHGLTPMAPEAQLLEGAAGYFPPNIDISSGQIVATHGSTGNPTLCASCHVVSFNTTFKDTGQPFSAVGHTFNAIPCLSNGIPSGELTCALDTTVRNWSGCTASGCHGSAQAALSALTTRLLTVRARSDTLLAMLTRVDPNLDGAGGAIDPNNDTLTVADGAFFNYNLANWEGHVGGFVGTHPDISLVGSTVHNPFLITALLDASIAAVKATYPAASASVSPAYIQKIKSELSDIRSRGPVH